MRINLVFLILMALHIPSHAASPEPTNADDAIRKGLLLVAVRPDYPYEARRARLTGSGIFELKFDYESGNLREVHVVQSTGQRLLDGHAISALKLWKAKPRSIHSLIIPITFTMNYHR